MVAAALCFSLSFSFVRYLSDYMSTFQIVFLRQAFGFVFMLPWLAKVGFSGLRTTRLRLHIQRALLGYAGMLAGYYSLKLIPMADSVALQFTLPLFTAILAMMFLGEKVGVHRWAAIAVGFVGVLVIIRPGFAEVNIGMMFALLAPLCYAGTDTTARAISRTDTIPVMMFYGFVLQLPLAAAPMPWQWTPPPVDLIPAIVAFAAVAICAQWCLTRSLALAEASLVAPVLFLRLPFVAAIGFFVFGQVSDIETWIGAGIIFVSTYVLAHREARAGRRSA